MSLEWMSDALCREIDGELFFPDNPNDNEAKKACALCQVKEPCLQYALERPVLGIWGGTNERERRQLRRKAA